MTQEEFDTLPPLYNSEDGKPLEYDDLKNADYNDMTNLIQTAFKGALKVKELNRKE